MEVPPPPPPPTSSETRVPPPPGTNGAPPPPPSVAVQPPALKRKREPMDLEEVLRKKREADLANSKPTFLSKKERTRLALEKREREVEEQKKRTQAERGFTNGNGVNGDHHKPHDGVSNGINSSRQDERPVIPTGPRAMRTAISSKQDMAPPPPPPQENGGGKPRVKNNEKDRKQESAEEKAAREHQERYMGAAQNMSKFSAKKRKRAEKKFVFDWNNEEDTSQDHNPIYQNRSEAAFYGRGRLGGYNPEAQDVASFAKVIASRDQVAGSDRAREMIEMDRRRREARDAAAIDVHWSEKPLSAMRERDYRIMREDFAIATRGGQIPNPLRSWTEAGLPHQLLQLVERHYKDPMPVQRAAVPCAMAGRDVLAVAKTGSGKTASFLLPLLCYILHRISVDNPRDDCPYAVIMAPTRELAQQIHDETRKFAQPLGISSVVVVGGHNISIDARALFDESTDILIATPGRLADCIEQKVVNLSDTKYLVLDEVDRMLDMGFEAPISVIMNALNSSSMKPDTDEAERAQAVTGFLRDEDRYRTTMMYTATLPPSVERTTRQYLRRPATVQIGVKEEAAETIEQRVEFVSGEDKRRDRLLQLLNHEFHGTVLVFVNIKAQVDALTRQLTRAPHHIAADSLHGGKDQNSREAAVAAVRRGDTRVLVATDLAGRGLDIPDVEAVINYNLPRNIEPYTHRIGRTGRAGKRGVAVSFMDSGDQEIMYDLKVMLQRSPLSRVPEELRRHEASQKPFVRGQQKG